MSIIRKIELLFVGLLILAVLGLGMYSWHLSESRDRVQQDYQQQSGNAHAGNTAAQELRILVTEKEDARNALDEALEAHPEWADAPVPADVADLLRHDSGTARAVP